LLKLAFLLHRKPGMTRQEFQTYWRETHAPIVNKYKESGYTAQYVQCHTRESSMTDAARRSRAGEGNPLTDIFDGVAQIYWNDISDIQKGMDHPLGKEGGRAMYQDEKNFIDLRRSPLIYGEEHVIIGDPDPMWRTKLPRAADGTLNLIKMTFPVNRKQGMGEKEFYDYWLNNHGPLVRKYAPNSHILRYVQFHTRRDIPYMDPIRQHRAGKGNEPAPIFDGMAEVWWTSMDDIMASATDPKGPEMAKTLYEDEAKFLDFSTSPLFHGEEKIIFP
jgi:uncharacterized protein (TIGR02118 family)